MIVRQARAQDAPAIARIVNDIVQDTLITFTTRLRDPGSVRSDIEARGAAFVVAEAEHTVLGFATYGTFRNGPGYAHTKELSINLVPAARGQGVGRQLMQRLEAVANQAGVHVLVAGISSANPTGVEFHAALGFREVGRMPEVGFKAGRWLDLILMQKNLPVRTDSYQTTG